MEAQYYVFKCIELPLMQHNTQTTMMSKVLLLFFVKFERCWIRRKVFTDFANNLDCSAGNHNF